MNTIQVTSQITGNPTELEKQMYEALAMIVDELRFPFEVTKGGLTLIRLSPEQVSQVETAFQLFTVIHGLELRRGKYVEAGAVKGA